MLLEGSATSKKSCTKLYNLEDRKQKIVSTCVLWLDVASPAPVAHGRMVIL